MKLYTEEQIKQILEELQKAFLPKNIECDGAHCIGCWKDVVRTTMQMANSFTPIQLPSDEEIIAQTKDFMFESNKEVFYNGAKWMRDKIQVGEK
jgi:ferredoxin